MQIKIIKDLKDIIFIINKFNSEFESVIDNLEEYAKKIYDNANVIGLFYKNNIIGFSTFYCNNEKEKVAYISRIAVLDEYRSKGYGSELLSKSEQISKDNGMNQMRLEVYKDNTKAIEK